MDNFLGPLFSMFGAGTPAVAASLGIEPPSMPTGAASGGAGVAGGSVWDPQEVPLPRPRPDNLGEDPNASAGAAASLRQPAGADPSKMLNGLRGMAAPQVPTPQRVSTPSAPRQADIQQGEIIKLLLAQAGGGAGGAGGAAGRSVGALPGTLGQALNMPRY